MARVKGKQYFENKLPSLWRAVTVKHTSDKCFSLNNKTFETEADAKKFLNNRNGAIGVFEITHVYGDKNATTPNHEYGYRGFQITNFDRAPDELASGARIQFLMVDTAAGDLDTHFHGDRESLGLALDYIDAYLHNITTGKIKVKRSGKAHNTKPSNKKYIIIHTADNGTNYLAWQKPAYDESGYFWTNRKTFMKVLRNSTYEHPFLFDSKRDACTWLRRSGITARCKISTIRINKSARLNDPIMDGYAYPGISADIGLY